MAGHLRRVAYPLSRIPTPMTSPSFPCSRTLTPPRHYEPRECQPVTEPCTTLDNSPQSSSCGRRAIRTARANPPGVAAHVLERIRRKFWAPRPRPDQILGSGSAPDPFTALEGAVPHYLSTRVRTTAITKTLCTECTMIPIQALWKRRDG